MHTPPGRDRTTAVGADGIRLGLRTIGDGAALLLVHGGMGTADRWDPLLPLLTEHVEITAMDRRGRGSSGDGEQYSLAAEQRDVLAVAEHLAHRQGSPIDVLAHSFGALCALGAAAAGAPMRRLVLYEPPGPPTVTADWLERMRALIAQDRPGPAMVSFLVDVIGYSPQEVQALRERAGGGDPLPIVRRTMVREAEALRGADLTGLAVDVRQPVMLLLGTESRPWASAVTRQLAAALPNAEIVDLPGQGHEAIDRNPQLVAERVLAHLGAT
ncbi:hypothetical protein CFK38_13320 [Brachybacterium vulturis]|uniref:AB hydrolase-1 domain-containing protein n=1 Tax=Brachybacterium vulturis TaxID=2017484 RepID=A0A291GPV3_9MICO|nr:alpha/beta hydrolase [Brachybacterium vulturis]ATG52389.1 hypothetical protein CFK38_13320 [Brachybacterium vulturis]